LARGGVEEAKPRITAQFDAFAALLAGRFFMGAEAGAVDFAVYALAGLVKRLETPRRMKAWRLGSRPDLRLGPRDRDHAGFRLHLSAPLEELTP
jgi:glutathione S-transferase